MIQHTMQNDDAHGNFIVILFRDPFNKGVDEAKYVRVLRTRNAKQRDLPYLTIRKYHPRLRLSEIDDGR